MSGHKQQKEQPKPERLDALRTLPPEITKNLTKEEVTAFLFEEEWPDSLCEKLKDFMV